MAEVVTLGLLIALALALRVYKLDKSLWLDEVITCRHAGRSIVDVLHRSYPFYMLIMHFLLPYGSSEVFLRLPSLLAGLAGVGCTYGLARKVSGRTAAFVAAFLVAVSAFHVEHSQEMRYYSVMALTAVLTAWALRAAVLRGGKWRWLGVLAASGIGIANHIMFVPFLGAMMAGAGLAALGKGKYRAVGALVLCGLVLAGVFVPVWIRQGNVPWTMVRRVFGSSPTPVQEPTGQEGDSSGASTRPVERPERLHVSQYLAYGRELFGNPNTLAAATLITLGFLGIAWLLARRVLMAAMILASVVLVPLPFFIFPAGHFYAARYFIPLLPLLAIAAGTGVCALGDGGAALWRRFRATHGPDMIAAGQAIASLAVLAILGVSAYASLGRYYEETPRWDWKRLMRETADGLRPGDRIVYVRPSDLEWTTDWCAEFYRERFQTCAALCLIEPDRVTTPIELAELARKHPNAAIWVVGARYEPLVPATIGAEFESLLGRLEATRRDYGQAVLYRIPAPATNLIVGGDFENAGAGRPAVAGVREEGGSFIRGNVRELLSSDAYEGDHAGLLIGPEPSGRQPNLFFDVPYSAESRKSEPLIFSAMVKHVNYATFEEPRLVAEVVLVATNRGGDFTWKTLKRIEYSRDWHLVAAKIDFHEDIPTGVLEWRVGFAFNNSAGKLWIDNVQLQRGELPSPFVNGTRPPHDVVLWGWSALEEGAGP